MRLSISLEGLSSMCLLFQVVCGIYFTPFHCTSYKNWVPLTLANILLLGVIVSISARISLFCCLKPHKSTKRKIRTCLPANCNRRQLFQSMLKILSTHPVLSMWYLHANEGETAKTGVILASYPEMLPSSLKIYFH